MTKRRGGYILVEALVAMTLLSLGMISISNALGSANYTRAVARDRTDARFLLEELVGSIEIQPLIEAETVEGQFEKYPRFSYSYTVDILEIPAPPIPPEVQAQRNQSLQQQQPEEIELPVAAIGRIRATVFWTRLGDPYNETVETLVQPERLPQQQVAEFLARQRQGFNRAR